MSLPYPLTVAYLTARTESMVQWFLDSLRREVGGNYEDYGIKVLVIDFYGYRGRTDRAIDPKWHTWWMPPKPTVWQGPNRKTNTDYFAAANARNTALCCAKDGWLAMVDDLSVLMPGWLSSIRNAMTKNYIVWGAYKKVKRLVVDNGVPVSWVETPEGVDSRWNRGSDNDAIPITSGGTYGCSFAAPVEVLIKINGFDERCDCLGMGSEDDMAGLMLLKQGYEMRYDRRMLTLESEERHHWEPPLKRVIETGYGDKDASWALLNSVKGGDGRAPNEHLGKGGISALRHRILAGEPFPKPTGPTHNWYSKRPVSEY